MNGDFVEMLSASCPAGAEFLIIGRHDFIANKRASGRPKDLSDLTLLPPAVNDERRTRNDE